MAEPRTAGHGDVITNEPPTIGPDPQTPLSTSTSPIASSTTATSSTAADDALLSLSPDDILAALRDADAISPATADRHASAITRGIREASATERALGLRAAGVGSKARAWCVEIAGWSWTGSFATADRDASRASEGTTAEGSIPAVIVAEREARVEAIRDELEALDVEELKEYVRSVHTLPNSRGSSIYELDMSAPSMVKHLDDFTALVTGTILGTLPYIHRLNRLLALWSVRLLVLHQVPAFLESLWSSRTAVDSAWNAVRPEVMAPDQRPELSREAYDTMQAVLEPRVSHLAKVIDSMLDTLEGHQDTLPDEWIDLMEAVQADYEEWVILARRLADNFETQKVQDSKKEQGSPDEQPAATSTGLESAGNFAPAAASLNLGDADLGASKDSSRTEASNPSETSMRDTPPFLPPRSPMREQPSFVTQDRNALPSNNKIGNQIPGLSKVHPAAFTVARQEPISNESTEPPRTPRRTPAPLLVPGRDNTSNSSSRNSSPPHSATSSSFASDISEPQIMEASPIHLTTYSPIRGTAPELLTRRDSARTERSMSTVRGSIDLGESKESSRSSSSLGQPVAPAEVPAQTRVRNIMIKRNDSDSSAEHQIIPEATEAEEHPSMLEDEYDEESDREPSPTREPRTLEEQLARRIRSILTNIPGRIQLATSHENDLADPKHRSVSGQSRSASGHTIPPLPNRQLGTGITLAPAFEKKASPKVHSGNSEIKVYHLLQPDKDRPIKLYVRLVGDEERVMVRVGGGWADLETYLKAYAVHHGGRAVSGTRPEPKVVTDTQPALSLSSGNGNNNQWSEMLSHSESPTNGRSVALANHKVRPPSAMNSPRTPEGMIRRGDSLVPGYFDGADMKRIVTGGSSSGAEDPGVGLGGVKRDVELSPTRQAWVDGMLDQATRQVSGETKKRSEFGDLELVASLNLLGKIAWIRLDNEHIRFTVVPDQGTQVWAVIAIDSVFDDGYTIQSNAENNTINLEVPLAHLHRALKSAQNAANASIRLTKKDGSPVLSVTITVPTPLTSVARSRVSLDVHPAASGSFGVDSGGGEDDAFGDGGGAFGAFGGGGGRSTTITQDVPARVLSQTMVEGIHEPRCPDPEVHIMLPSLLQLKAISERFTRLAMTTKKNASSVLGSSGPKLEIAANMHGELRIGIRSEALRIQSQWSGLHNPELDPNQVEGGTEGLANHPSTRMKNATGEDAWAVVRVEGRDWGRVLGVGRMGGRVIACFCHERALILYVYLPNDDSAEESVLTYYVTSYST